MSVTVGAKAPQFTLADTTKTPRSPFSESTGKKVVLLFYPGAFTGVCDKEMCNFRDSMSSVQQSECSSLWNQRRQPVGEQSFCRTLQIELSAPFRF